LRGGWKTGFMWMNRVLTTTSPKGPLTSTATRCIDRYARVRLAVFHIHFLDQHTRTSHHGHRLHKAAVRFGVGPSAYFSMLRRVHLSRASDCHQQWHILKKSNRLPPFCPFAIFRTGPETAETVNGMDALPHTAFLRGSRGKDQRKLVKNNLCARIS
jgi:hypothetical protein